MVLPELVSIVCGDNISTICPALGGSIIGWSVGEQEMLRRADADAIASGDPLAMASCRSRTGSAMRSLFGKGAKSK